jgi:ubiquinone/menaquinone biosynthesis C-methylase UbiE
MNTEQRLTPLLKVKYPKELIDNTIPAFSPKTTKEKNQDKYESSTNNVDYYIGGVTYASQLLNIGGAESLYSTINYLMLKHFDKNKKYTFLDLACGVGRTMYDLAELFPESLFVGLDYSYLMVKRSKQILQSNEGLEIDLEQMGFGKLILPSKNYNNVALAQGDVYNLPFKENIFDAVCNTFLIDRVEDPEEAIRKSIKMLKPGGLFIFTNPLNFNTKENWGKELTAERIVSIVESCGINITNWHDGLIFKQKMDSRDNYYSFSTLVIHGVKN